MMGATIRRTLQLVPAVDFAPPATAVCLIAAFLMLGTRLSDDAGAAVVAIANPGDPMPGGGAYASTATLLPITTPEFDVTTSLADPDVTVTFSVPLMSLSVLNGSWFSWSSPPFSETGTPDVLWTQGVTTLEISFSTPLTVFGFELQPNELNVFTITATYFNGSTVLDSIIRDVDGDAGARLFAAVSTPPTDPFTSVRISTGGADFGIAQLRYVVQQQPPLPSAVPEPCSAVACSLLGLFLLGMIRRKPESKELHR